jgi:hypothetical protein
MRKNWMQSEDKMPLKCRHCKIQIADTFLYDVLQLNSIKDPQLLTYLGETKIKKRSYTFDFICKSEVLFYMDCDT